MIIKTRQTALARFLDIGITLLAWALFIWLIADGINQARLTRRVSTLELGNQFFATLNSLILYLGLSALVTLILLGWAKYNQVRSARYQRRQRVPIIEDRTLCTSFNVEPSILPLLQAEQVMTIFNDEQGGIDSALLASQGRVLAMQLPLHMQSSHDVATEV